MAVAIGALAVLGVLGVLFGIVLAVASRIFHVDIDQRIEQIAAILPGANCGGCGYPGCMGYAEALVTEGVDATLCSAGGGEVTTKIGDILGVAVEAGARKYPIVRCQGREAAASFAYDGVETCGAAAMLQGGFKQCAWGCLGLGDCSRVCPVGAITMDSVPVVNEEICISCGKCATACPKKIIEMVPEDMHVHVLCLNHDKGKAAKEACPAACIGCKKCEKECPFDAIHVNDFLAVIDYTKCKNCGKCVKVCPQGCIVTLRKERKERQKGKEAQQPAAARA